MGALLASPIISAVISIAVAYIAFTIKRVAMNVVIGGLTYWVCVHVLEIPMDIGVGIWALTAILGPIPMVLAAIYYGIL